MRLYNRGLLALLSDVDWSSSPIGVLLVDETYSFDPDHNLVTDLSGELDTDNYTRPTLANATVTQDDANDRVVLDADDTTFSALGPASGGPTVGGVILYHQDGGGDASSRLIAFVDLVDRAVNGSDFILQWPETGIIYVDSPAA